MNDAPHKLQRRAFKTSVALGYVDAQGLTTQTGFAPRSWPVYALKELLDNAIDACEDADIAPVLTVVGNNDGLTVEDNGPGIPAETIAAIGDYSVSVSSRAAYVSPTRGAQGNALKTILAMPRIVSGGDSGTIEIEAHGKLHRLAMKVDLVAQTIDVEHDERKSARKIGTLVRIGWPKFASSLSQIEAARFLQIAEDFAWLNPNLDLTVRLGKKLKRYKPTDAAWPHWKANKPTSPHWYNLERFTRLVSRYADEEKGMTVRAFVATFDGLSATAKQKAVLEATGMARATLISIARDQRVLRKLLAAMQAASREVNPELLGVIGEKHFRQRCKEAGCFMPHFRYARGVDLIDGVPSLVEVAFCTDPGPDDYIDAELMDVDDADSEEVAEVARRLITGVNWAPGLRDTFRDIGDRKSLDTLLGDKLISYGDPVYCIVHVVCPRPQYMDRGKSGVVLPMSYSKFEQLIDAATKHWQKQRRAEIKDDRAKERRFRQLNRTNTQKQSAFNHMEKAYLKASDNGKLPANQRQIMYALRPMVIAEVPGTDPSAFDRYFHNTLLDEYLNAHKPDWADNVVRDARGGLQEPHTGRTIELGTLAVRSYLQRVNAHKVSEPDFSLIEARYPTLGPKHAFGAILYVEKEGFEPLLAAAQIAERFDIGVMSNKGMSVRATRHLIDELYRFNVPVFVLHDFDKSGFSILGTLGRDSIRYKFRHRERVKIIDIGLRLEDVEDLDSEPQFNNVSADTVDTMRRYGCTEDELEFILGPRLNGHGQRVELNAMTSRQLVDFIERKLAEHGVKKIVPSDAELAEIYVREVHMLEVQERVDRIVAKKQVDSVKPPQDLSAKISAWLKKHPEQRWDAAMREIAQRRRTRMR